MADEKKLSPTAIALVAALVLGPLAGWLGYAGAREGRLASAAEPSTCSVLGAGAEARGESYVPWVILVHTIAGERFERRDEAPPRDTESEARQSIADVSPGQQVPCRYLAGAPSLVTYFERDPGAANLKLLGAGACAFGLLLALGWAVMRSRRPRA